MTLSKRAMLALTRALEDEYCAHAGAGVLVGSFQRVRFYRQSERRWRELARTARAAVVLADFTQLRRRPGYAAEVPVSREHPLAREWAIIFHLPDAGGCLAAWEIPSVAGGERGRRFEALWSPEREVALEAIGVAAGLLEPLAPALAGALARATETPAAASPTALRSVVGQAHRMIAYLGARDRQGEAVAP
jgi:DICT domain-containing protein